LVLCSACGSNCLYCPKNRGQRIPQKVMTLETVKKIVDELCSESFKKNHDLFRIEVGENGDALLNKDFLEILRHVKSRMPEIRIELFTNFSNFTKEKAEVVVKEKLLDAVFVNIDGSNKEAYQKVKCLDFDKVIQNIKDFVALRDVFYPRLDFGVYILDYNTYVDFVRKTFGFNPSKMSSFVPNPDDEFERIMKLIENLNIKNVQFDSSSVFAWAEREQVDKTKIDYSKHFCPLLSRIENEVFIAPDGTCYLCCFDANNELVLGNVYQNSIHDMHYGSKKKDWFEKLKNKDFKSIDGPCQTVNCCQIYKVVRNK